MESNQNVTEVTEVTVRDAETIVTEIRTTIANVQMTALTGAIAVGEKIKEIKELVPHGEWLSYIQEKFSWTERKVQRFVQIADSYGDDDTAYSKLVKSDIMMTDLSVTNALKLLAIPEEDVEEFAETHIEEGQTSRDLDEEIKKYKDENSDLEEEVLKLNKKLDEAKNTGVTQEEYDKIQNKLDAARKKLDKADKEKDSAVAEAVKKASEDAYKDAKIQSAKEVSQLAGENEELKTALVAAEKKAANIGDPVLITFKNRTDDWQSAFIEMQKCIVEVQTSDMDKANGMRKAISGLMSDMEDKLQGIVK